MKLKIFSPVLLWIAGFLLMSVAITHAQTAEKPLLDTLPLLSASKVTVYRNLAGSPYPSMNEEKFKRISCTYQVEDRGLIRVLVRLLEGSDMRKNTLKYAQQQSYRDDYRVWGIFYGIYFQFPDGTETKILYSGDEGYLISLPQYDREPITFHHSFEHSLAYWLTHLAPPTVDDQGAFIPTPKFCQDYLIRGVFGHGIPSDQ